ncbi:uncharacterized protein LOC109408513 [Aedes albopictus]|uniref:Secreted protein n=1 Tax=Aedes albopictus TaxID=7160 RepID=A0ABM1YYQ8_AEDAL
MLVHLHPQVIAVATPLLILSLIIVHSNARVLTKGHMKASTLSVAHNEEEIMVHDFDYPTMMEKDEANEVIAVRLLNSHRTTSFQPNSAELQNVSYENVQEDPKVTLYDGDKGQRDAIEPTTISIKLLSTTSQKSLPADDYSLEKDWVRSRIEIPVSSEEDHVSFVTSTTQKSRTEATTTHVPTLTISSSPLTTPKVPLVFGYRRRKPRNYNYYDDLPEIDFDQIDVSELEDSKTNDQQFMDIIAEGFQRSKEDKPSRSKKRRPKKQPKTTSTTPCPCLYQKRQPLPSYDYAIDYDDGNDDDQYIEPKPRRPPVKKRLISHQNRLPPPTGDDDYLTDPSSSIERVERVQSALERIMGIVTIMSHVDSFIHKKTKQSIRRLAKLYESVEE